MEAVPCNATAASQKGWELRRVDGSFPAVFQIVVDNQCVDFGRGGRVWACNATAPGQVFLHNANKTLTEVSTGKCVDIGAKVGPGISVGSCNAGENQKFEFAAGGVWKDAGTGERRPGCQYPPCITPPRCMQRRKGNPRHDDANDIYFQIWAKPQPEGATAVLVLN